tara:strand:+ start:241 stop:840 length:600 start_codon:yes stop_codon:yes gene_type:complete
MNLLIATRNKGKLKEIRNILNLDASIVKSSLDYPEIPDVIEDKDTLEGNAIKKACEMANATGCWALSDDSGLEVEALNGAPGVYSARYAGENCSYLDNINKLLYELDGIENRRAVFKTVLCLVNLVGEVRTVKGICKGIIALAPTGKEGFGYDPIFIPDGYNCSFAELTIEEKNKISHRGRALTEAIRQWGFILSKFNK